MRSKHLSATIVVLLACLGLTACNADDAQESPASDLAASSTPTPSPEPATPSAPPPPPATPYPHPTPQEPEGMYQHTDGGAIVTAKYFVELMGYQACTGDIEKMKKISLPECEYCNGRMEYAKHVLEIGGWADNYHTTNITLRDYLPPPEGEIGDLAVGLIVDIPGYFSYIPDENGLEET
ncbi:MAG: DUF6318 family protein, partial [Actinomycetaceae bacterium]|nr:DUF6318 family protein [Actinomycetaceae bacterium]